MSRYHNPLISSKPMTGANEFSHSLKINNRVRIARAIASATRRSSFITVEGHDRPWVSLKLIEEGKETDCKRKCSPPILAIRKKRKVWLYQTFYITSSIACVRLITEIKLIPFNKNEVYNIPAKKIMTYSDVEKRAAKKRPVVGLIKKTVPAENKTPIHIETDIIKPDYSADIKMPTRFIQPLYEYQYPSPTNDIPTSGITDYTIKVAAWAYKSGIEAGENEQTMEDINNELKKEFGVYVQYTILNQKFYVYDLSDKLIAEVRYRNSQTY